MFILIFSIIEYFVITLITSWINIKKEKFSINYNSFKFSMSKNLPNGMNTIIKIFFPPIYIVILSGILYKFSYEAFISNIYLITIIYYLIKWFLVIFIFNKKVIINWKNEFVCFILASFISWLLYAFFITKTRQIFIPLDALRDGIWIGIFTFFFSLIIKGVYKQDYLNKEEQEKKIKSYVESKYKRFNSRYSDIIKTNNLTLKNLTYAIMIYENYNRPTVIRICEYIKFIFTKNASLGVMQVETNKIISNKTSVKLGYRLIKKSFYSTKKHTSKNSNLKKVIFSYNKSELYVKEVMYIYRLLQQN